MNNVVTRFAPSPTGYFHAGSYRTALFAYLYARKHGGKFILRIEDTDKERSKKEYEDNIMDSLAWLGLKHDEFYRQSDRGEIYKKYIQEFLDKDIAYISKETPKEKGDRAEVIRFRNPNKKVTFKDVIRGDITFDTTELGDFVIAKSIDEPIFHTVNVIDDFLMGITHVIRGEDHISNTPRQILIYEALGAPVPLFAHIPLLLSADRAKLSKRHGAVPVSEYRTQGYIPEAIVNYFALLGWHSADDREMFTMEELTKEFSLDRVQKSGAVFDEEKLKWFNRQYISQMPLSDFSERCKPFLPEWLSVGISLGQKVLPIIKDKVAIFGEIPRLFTAGGELYFIHKQPEYIREMLLWKKNPDIKSSKSNLLECRALITKVNDWNFTIDNIKSALWPLAEAKGKGEVLWPLRIALTGQERSPDPFTCAYILGKDETIRRIDAAIKKCD